MASSEQLFDTLTQYRNDPLFCVPERARDIFERRGDQTCFVLLGTKDFAAVFLGATAAGAATVLGVVDDFKTGEIDSFHGSEIISTQRFLALCAADADVIALNCCRFDHSRRFFENLCRTHGITQLNHEQAVRLLGLQTFDHRTADWAPTISERFDEFLALEHRLADTGSAETLRAVLAFHLSGDPEWHLQVSRPYSSLYFRSGLFGLSQHEKLVDCGASIGESTTALIGITGGRFDHSWMIEPDRFNIETLGKLQAGHAGTDVGPRLSLHSCAAGESDSRAAFHHQGGHSGSLALSDPDALLEEVSIRPIDSIIDDVPTFLKMDIEGAELSALRGAVGAIQAGRPKLALSAYHRPTDLLDLPAFVDSIAPGYTLGLRHHTEDRWDTCLYFY